MDLSVSELEGQDNYKPDIVVFLQPTSPSRSAGDADMANRRSSIVEIASGDSLATWSLLPTVSNSASKARGG